ncbi:MAG TPA: 2-hydroxyacid dehydrogenase [Thermomicrobiales bacterium]|nr:2-hydroxyacid dehydrogenase [Thermomicrobiales bacterium]
MSEKITTILVPAADTYVTEGGGNIEDPSRILATIPNVRLLTFEPNTPLPGGASDVEILVTGGSVHPPMIAGFPGSLPNLRMIQTLSAGVNNWLGHVPDGVILCNARGAHGGATSEWAATALLTIFRDFPRYILAQPRHEWARIRSEGLHDKRVLIVGAGDLANQLKRKLVAFDAIVTLVGRTAREGVHSFDDLPGLLPRQDAVVLMVPQTTTTTHLVDAAFLARMEDHAVLINAARGPIVDTNALLAELTSGRLRAGLDVTNPEPLPADHPLWDLPNVLITPHVGGATDGGDTRSWTVAREQVTQFLAGQRPSNAFAPEDLG